MTQNKTDTKKRVFLKTYGCQMNEYDTEIIRAILEEKNYALVDNEGEADVILLNTCSVRDSATRKVFAEIHSLRHRLRNKNALIGILGCMATDYREPLVQDKALDIDFIAGPDSYRRLPELITESIETHEKSFDITLSEFENYSGITPQREKGINAWVAVMRGCNNFCTFCVVPYTRGRERSRPPKDILSEIERVAQEGFPQVTLLGQNVNSYRFENADFSSLVEQITQVKGIKRIRFMSPHPKDFPERLLNVIAQSPKVCKHIHLPLQAGNDRILSLMNRQYTQEEYLSLVEAIRKKIPSIVLTTDVIVGFPTETAEEFEDTFRVIRDVQFDSAFIFKYSERKNTVASRKYPDDVTEEAKTERIVRLNNLQKDISLCKNQAHLEEMHEILIEEESTQKSIHDVQGRTDGNKLVIIPQNGYRLGDLVKVKITDATPHVLKGTAIPANKEPSIQAY